MSEFEKLCRTIRHLIYFFMAPVFVALILGLFGLLK